jgi:GNAT superfamily N-acetyltransferase
VLTYELSHKDLDSKRCGLLLKHEGSNAGFLVYYKGIEGFVWFSTLYVRPDHRRKGLAHRLVSEFIRLEGDKNILVTVMPFLDKPMTSEALRVFYGKYGFVYHDYQNRMIRKACLV